MDFKALTKTRQMVVEPTLESLAGECIRRWPQVGNLLDHQTTEILSDAVIMQRTSLAISRGCILSLVPNPWPTTGACQNFFEGWGQALTANSKVLILFDHPFVRKIYYQAYRRYGFSKIPPHQILDGHLGHYEFASQSPDQGSLWIKSNHLLLSETSIRQMLANQGFRDFSVCAPRLSPQATGLGWNLLLENPPFMAMLATKV